MRMQKFLFGMEGCLLISSGIDPSIEYGIIVSLNHVYSSGHQASRDLGDP